MLSREILVGSHREDIESSMATQFACDCGTPLFNLIKINDQHHSHVSCVACGHMYCVGGTCDNDIMNGDGEGI